MNQDSKQFATYCLQQVITLLDANVREGLISRLKAEIPAIGGNVDATSTDTAWVSQVTDYFAHSFDPSKLRVAS
jgi:hypothetical protein